MRGLIEDEGRAPWQREADALGLAAPDLVIQPMEARTLARWDEAERRVEVNAAGILYEGVGPMELVVATIHEVFHAYEHEFVRTGEWRAWPDDPAALEGLRRAWAAELSSVEPGSPEAYLSRSVERAARDYSHVRAAAYVSELARLGVRVDSVDGMSVTYEGEGDGRAVG